MPAKHVLFDAKTYKGKFPKPFDEFNCSGIEIRSIYNDTMNNTNLHPAAVKALLSYCDVMETGTKNATGEKDGEFVCGELFNADENATFTVLIKNDGKVMASTVSKPVSGLNVSQYNVGAAGRSGTAVLFTAIELFKKDPKDEFGKHFEEFYQEFKAGFTDEEKAVNIAAVLCDNMYRRVLNDSQDGGVTLEIPATGNIPQISQIAIEKGTYSPDSVLHGEFTYLKPGTRRKRKKRIAHKDFIGQYPLTERSFSDIEINMIPSLPDWYVIPTEVDNACRHLQLTTGSNYSMRNIMLRGPAGTGKTAGASAIAAGLGLPYVYLTCSANTEVFDLVGQIIPKLSKDGETVKPSDIAASLGLPDESDIMMDPVYAYEMITGISDETKTSEDCFREMLKRISEEMAAISSNGKEFEYIDTPLIQALKNGWVCELQEPTVIMQPGVLVGLNSLLDQCGGMMLPTGEKLVRHPDAVVVVTTNISYEGCRNLNQSFISRMNMILDMDEPSLSVKVQRVKNITGCTDKDLVQQLAETADKIAEFCKEMQITDGVCGMRELISWVQSAMITEDAAESSLFTIVAAATSDSDARRDIISSCLEPVFGRVA